MYRSYSSLSNPESTTIHDLSIHYSLVMALISHLSNYDYSLDTYFSPFSLQYRIKTTLLIDSDNAQCNPHAKSFPTRTSTNSHGGFPAFTHT